MKTIALTQTDMGLKAQGWPQLILLAPELRALAEIDGKIVKLVCSNGTARYNLHGKRGGDWICQLLDATLNGFTVEVPPRPLWNATAQRMILVGG
jgi:hypothetical protein